MFNLSLSTFQTLVSSESTDVQPESVSSESIDVQPESFNIPNSSQ